MADGNSAVDIGAATAAKNELLELASPMGREAKTLVSDVLVELADVLELARLIVSQCPQDIVDDSAVRSALESTLHRAHERAETASKIAHREAVRRG